MSREIRTITVELLKIEQRADGKKIIRGHAAVFNERADIMGWFAERIEKGAFSKTIRDDDIRGLFNHDPNFVLGRNRSGTLRLEEDDEGLFMEVEPPDAQWARDLVVTIERGDITGQSFSFRTRKDEWDYTNPDKPLRTLREVELFDVGPVTFPAYEATDVSVALRMLVPEAVRELAKRAPGPFGRAVDLARRRLGLKRVVGQFEL